MAQCYKGYMHVLPLLMYWALSFAIIASYMIYSVGFCRAGGIGPAAPVLAGPVYSQGKSKILFLQKASNKQSASVILGLIRLTIIDRKGISRGARLSAAHALRSLLCSQGTLLCKS